MTHFQRNQNRYIILSAKYSITSYQSSLEYPYYHHTIPQNITIYITPVLCVPALYCCNANSYGCINLVPINNLSLCELLIARGAVCARLANHKLLIVCTLLIAQLRDC